MWDQPTERGPMANLKKTCLLGEINVLLLHIINKRENFYVIAMNKAGYMAIQSQEQ